MVLRAIAVFVLSILLHMPHIGRAPLAGTEGHRAMTAHQMVESGQWTVPMLFGRVYLRKPPLHYWVIAGVETVAQTGNEFVWRLPSVLFAGLLNAMLFLVAGRWFGRAAAWVAGLGGLGLVALWSQQSTADIDSADTFFACLTAFCYIELLYRSPSRRGVLMVCTGLAFGCSLMVKGPAGLPLILGALVWTAITRWRSGKLREMRRWHVWTPVLIAVAIAGVWVLSAKRAVEQAGLRPDYSGIVEGANNLSPGTVGRFFEALVIGPTLWAYALPLSLTLPALLLRPVRRVVASAPDWSIIFALAGSTVTAWAICTLSGMANPRYGYSTLPALCVMGGGLVAAMAREARPAAMLKSAAGITAVCFAAAAVSLAVVAIGAANRAAPFRADGQVAAIVAPAAVGAAGAAVLMAGLTVFLLRRGSARGAVLGFAGLIATLSVPFGLYRSESRWDDSGIVGARVLARTIGQGTHLELSRALTFQPELFYYAQVDARAHPIASFTPAAVGKPSWVLLIPAELRQWRAEVGDRLGPKTMIPSNGGNKNYVAWYAGDGSTPGQK